MSDTSSSLSLPFIQPNQAQKHVTHNEALSVLDVLVQLAVESDDETTPPPAPTEGARYIIGETPSGDWSGHAGEVAVFENGVWRFFAPGTGWRAYVAAQDALVVFDGADWVEVDRAELEDLVTLGLGMTSLPGTPFSAKLNSGLWTALYGVDGGTGSMIQTWNRESTSDDVGIVFQQDFQTRGLLGLFGDSDLRLSVSVDGSSFLDGLSIDGQTGVVSQPNLPRFKARTNFDNFCSADVWTKLAINVADANDQAAFDAATNVFTAPVDGTYMMGGTVIFMQDASDQARMGARLVVNGTDVVSGSVVSVDGPHVDQQTSVTLQTVAPLTAGDTVELQCIMRGFNGYTMADQTSFWGFSVG